jgi:hypothetical protein
MKKYLFGTLAIMLAVAFSAFTTKKNANFIQDKFVFVGNVKVQAQVIDNKNWLYVGQGQDPENEQLACESGTLICSTEGTVTTAEDLAVLDANGNYSLDPSIVTISAPSGNTGTGFIAQFSGYTMSNTVAQLAD